jgi:broad specificity phosphatase PhoE
VPVEVDERWIELDYGGLDGRPVASVPAEEWRRWRADLAHRPAGGESLAVLADRVEAACAELAPAAGEGVVIVVSHVSPIKAAVAWALGVGHDVAWRLYVEDASVARIDLGPDGPVLRWFNRHLAPAEPVEPAGPAAAT